MKINEGGGLEEEGENIEVLQLQFDETLSMIDNGEIKDAKTIMLLQHLRLKNIL
ncbi:GDP-mannose pyrophosphatase NudK [compost metagenome]